MSFFSFLKDCVAPKKCISCTSLGAFLCQDCRQKIPLNQGFCYICKKSSAHFQTHTQCQKDFFLDAVIVPCHYREKVIKTAITQGKFYKKREIFEEMTEMLSWYFEKEIESYESEEILIIPTPLHFLSKWKRGFNQTDSIAKVLEKRLWHPYRNILKKVKHTRQQSHLSREQRLKNRKNCFEVRKNYRDKLDTKTVFLVDDIISTGATMNEAAKLLKENGVKKVVWIVLASD